MNYLSEVGVHNLLLVDMTLSYRSELDIDKLLGFRIGIDVDCK